MNLKTIILTLTILHLIFLGCGEKDNQPPRVVRTLPLNESADVDPSMTEISVKFNEEMKDGNWSWVYENKSSFPQVVGQPYYTENNTRNVLPVKLEPDKNYVIWINSANHQNFKDKNGNSARPFRFAFKTGY